MRKPDQRGFSMIEVLVTILLITIGLLGLVAMQGRAIAYTQDSVQRNTAAMLTDDLFELMRANRDKILNALNKPAATSGYYKEAGAAFAEAPDSCSPTPKEPEKQLACWAESVKQALPGAAELLSSDFYIRPAGTAIEVQVAWMGKDDACINPDEGEQAGGGTGEPDSGSAGGEPEGSEPAETPEAAEDPEESGDDEEGAEEPAAESTNTCYYRLRSEL